MVDFCHGQAHRSTNHHHLVFVGNDLDQMAEMIKSQTITIDEGDRLAFHYDDHEFTCWLVTPHFQHHSAIRRLLRTSDGLVLHYTQGSVADIEHWHDTFDHQLHTITIVSDFDILEEMNQLFGTLSSVAVLKDTIVQTITSDENSNE